MYDLSHGYDKYFIINGHPLTICCFPDGPVKQKQHMAISSKARFKQKQHIQEKVLELLLFIKAERFSASVVFLSELKCS